MATRPSTSAAGGVLYRLDGQLRVAAFVELALARPRRDEAPGASDAATAPVAVGESYLSRVGCVRPGFLVRSIDDLHKAIELLEEAGEMRGSLAATAMKDLGLVYGFIHWFAGQTGTTLQELQTDEGYPPNRRDPEVEAEAWGAKAAELQEALVGRNHRSARNARRLMRRQVGQDSDEEPNGSESDQGEESDFFGEGGLDESLAAAGGVGPVPGAAGPPARPAACTVC